MSGDRDHDDDDDEQTTRRVTKLAPREPRPFGKELAMRRLQTIDAPAESFGRYSLLGALGRGGMAEVRLAAETRPDGAVRLCVLKLLSEKTTPDFKAALLEEGRIARRLQHPNIVELYDSGEVDKKPYLAFELVDGVSLRELIKMTGPARLPLSVVLEIGIQAAEALAHAHAARDERGTPLNVVHRDVTPHNILVERSGRVKLVDFGIAHFSGRGVETKTGFVKGKLGYLAPEVIRGTRIDGRTDVFMLGLVLTELIAGRAVLPRILMVLAELAPQIRQMLAEAPYPVPPIAVEYLVRMTALDIESRATALEAARELRTVAKLTGREPTLAALLARDVFSRLVPLDMANVVEAPTTRIAPLTSAASAITLRDEDEDEDESYATTVRVARLVIPPRS